MRVYFSIRSYGFILNPLRHIVHHRQSLMGQTRLLVLGGGWQAVFPVGKSAPA